MAPWNSITNCSTKDLLWGFPGGAVVENLPANAGDTGSSPGLGGYSMPRSNKAREPQLLSMRVWSLCSAAREAAIVRGPRTAMKSGRHLPQLEKALARKRRPNVAINQSINLKKKKKKKTFSVPCSESLPHPCTAAPFLFFGEVNRESWGSLLSLINC